MPSHLFHPAKQKNAEPDKEAVDLLQKMGFSWEAATAALIENAGNTEAAVDWLVSKGSELESVVPVILADREAKAEPPAFLDGEGHYTLVGFISHMGASTACGHYVCHIKKKDRWILFNDEKVAISEAPPRDLGYMYLYRRLDVQGVEE